MIKQIFNDKEIRFIEKDGEYWAVAGDVAKVLGYSLTPHMLRMIDKEDVTTHIVDSTSNSKFARKTQKVNIISEYGIYEAIWNSRRAEAQEFKKWVKQVIKELRQSTGLKGYEAFRMLDKEKQKEAMDNLKNGIEVISKKDYCKAQAISNKAVSNVFGFPKMIKKQDMTQEMLELRQQVLNDTVEFMVFVDKYNLPLSVKKHIYDKYNDKQKMA
ncbi:phage repressor protein [Staphylococcus epidermidis]|uniref:BRO-N domain-containing protein n=1 Tax=Staphylococcus epidermidis TaxID=1282 RepID=UPI001D14F76A|nr:BRO family protein [Staphylococcus epidermidis]MCC3672251.1 phage repressor protein [Staphylococcus epidermidis]MCC3700467.1 phage repressor protein [Staphylococcus epidermidis]MCG1078587.1 phage repressor protein [Staphylococcus epidermidis]MCG1255723.1 phage repressor protein [Staphylococcus epidermidis]MCG1258064.1 phage repressor protein [Staphylococcus epidermidis]